MVKVLDVVCGYSTFLIKAFAGPGYLYPVTRVALWPGLAREVSGGTMFTLGLTKDYPDYKSNRIALALTLCCGLYFTIRLFV